MCAGTRVALLPRRSLLPISGQVSPRGGMRCRPTARRGSHVAPLRPLRASPRPADPGGGLTLLAACGQTPAPAPAPVTGHVHLAPDAQLRQRRLRDAGRWPTGPSPPSTTPASPSRPPAWPTSTSGGRQRSPDPGGHRRHRARDPVRPHAHAPPCGCRATAPTPRWSTRGGASNNVNQIVQQMTTTNADVDPADNKVHVRFAIAPVLQNPGHTYAGAALLLGPAPQRDQGDHPLLHLQLLQPGRRALEDRPEHRRSSTPTGSPSTSRPARPSSRWATPWRCSSSPPAAPRAATTATSTWTPSAPSSPASRVTALRAAAGQHRRHADLHLQLQELRPGAPPPTPPSWRTCPAGTTFASLSAPGASCTTPAVGGTGAVTCNVGTVNPSASGSFTVTVNVTAASGSMISNGNYNIYADSVSSLIGPLVTTTVTSGVTYADLGVTKTDGVAAATWGQALTYTIVATNHGPGAANGATVTDTLPAQLTGATWTCAASGGAACNAPSGSGSISQAIPDLPERRRGHLHGERQRGGRLRQRHGDQPGHRDGPGRRHRQQPHQQRRRGHRLDRHPLHPRPRRRPAPARAR